MFWVFVRVLLAHTFGRIRPDGKGGCATNVLTIYLVGAFTVFGRAKVESPIKNSAIFADIVQYLKWEIPQ